MKRSSDTLASISLINMAVDIFLDHPQADQDTILSIFTSRGVPPEQSWRLYQFIPIAFAHVVLTRAGVRFYKYYIALHHGTQARVQRLLEEEEFYQAGIRVAKERVGTDTGQDLFPVFRHSAEYAAVSRLVQQGAAFRDIVCTEPMLFEYRDERA